MRKIILLLKIVSLLSILVICSQAQITSRTPEVEKNEMRVSQIISDSERYFKQGEFHIEDGRLPQAWKDFDKSVEVVLLSGINVKRNPKLNDYYLQLIERIYQIEATIKKKPVINEKIKFEFSPKCAKSELKNAKSVLEEDLTEAINFYVKGNDSEALRNLRRILSAEPMNGIAYLFMGKIHLRNGDITQAISSFKTALFWNNKLIEAYILLGKIYFGNGDFLQAQNYSRSALDIDSENERAQALSRLIAGIEISESRRILEDDSTIIEKPSQKILKDLTQYSDVILLVAPFRSQNNDDSLTGDFAYVLSKTLPSYNDLCVIENEEREKLIENFGFDTDEAFTLATAIKLAFAAKSNLLVVGQYQKTFNSIEVTAKLVRVNEGSFLSEELPNGIKIVRDIEVTGLISKLRILQGQIAYQILYQYDKSLPFSQNQFIDRASKIKLLPSLNTDGNLTNEPDFSTNNSLKKTTCDENTLESLQLRNFRLGMTLSEVTKLLPKGKIKDLSSYEKQIYQDFSSSTTQDAKFKDLTSIYLQFFDNRLYSIEIIYDDSIKWQNLSEFTLQVEQSLNLPTMKNGGYEFGGKYLYCGNYQFKVMLFKNGIPAIHLFNAKISNEIKQKEQDEKNKILQQKIEEEKRKKQLELEEKRRKKQLEEEKKKVFIP